MTATTCNRTVYEPGVWASSHPCGRPFKTPEQEEAKLCGRHLAGERRREANQEARRLDYEEQDEARHRAKGAASRLAFAGGLDDGTPFGRDIEVRDGGVWLSAEAADKLTALLAANESLIADYRGEG